jgi:putative phosphoesterase
MPSSSDPAAKPIRIGVIADTHIPDRAKALPDGVLAAFKAAGVDRILHAGDVSSWQVITTLEKIAPVTVVQGNRDWLFGMKTPRDATLEANSIQITIAHGHRTMLNYLIDKWAYITHGYLFKRYYDHLALDFPESDVIIFGHTHHQTALWVGDRLFFNPGAAYPCKHNHFTPEFGLLTILPDGTIQTECRKIQGQSSNPHETT